MSERGPEDDHDGSDDIELLFASERSVAMA